MKKPYYARPVEDLPNRVGMVDIWKENKDLKDRIVQVNIQNKELKQELYETIRSYNNLRFTFISTIMALGIAFFIIGFIGYI